MSVGAPKDQQHTDNTLFGLSLTARKWCADVDNLFLWWTGMTDAERAVIYADGSQGGDRAVAADAIYQFKSAADALRGLASPALPNNFLAAATKICGPNVG